VDTSQVFISDSAKAEDNEMLDFNNRLDGKVTAFGGILLLKNGCR